MMYTSRILAFMSLAIIPACGGQPIDEASAESALSSHGNKMKETLNGNGKGYVTPTPLADGYAGLSVHIELHLKHALPLTVYTVQRAAEAPSATSPDGICQNAAIPGKFATFAMAGVVVPGALFATDDEGEGETEFDFRAPSTSPFIDGSTFDVEFRAVDSTTAPTSDIRSDCLQVTVL